jgi:MscS family membrane protein
MTAELMEAAPSGRRRGARTRWGVPVAALILAALLCVSLLGQLGAPPPAQIADPLAPPDRSSPQATLACVQNETHLAAATIHSAFERHLHSAHIFADADERQAASNARAHLNIAMSCLDLSAVPPASREKIGTERVLMLSEVLRRLPPAAAPAGANVDRWTVPKTEITVARAANGPMAGQYLFTANTVERAPAFYAAVKNLPDDEHFDFYKFYSMSPGDLMPPKWYGFVLQLPEWALQEYADQALWQWFGYGFVLLLFAAASIALIVGARRPLLRKAVPSSYRRLLAPLGILIFARFAELLLVEINITGPVFSHTDHALIAIFYICSAWLVAAGMLSLAEWVANASGLRKRSVDAGMLRLALRLVGIGAAAGILALGASELGVPLVGIVAGLGVGGLAIALAAQPTIENLIGGVMLYADRPVHVGDECKFGDSTGVVEEIGIRSTRIRAKDRTLITIPNADFAKQRLTNTDRRDRLVVNGIVGLRYGTTQAQLRQVVEEAARFFERHPVIDEKASTLRLTEFGVYSLDLELVAQLTTRNRSELGPLRQEILLEIAGIVERAGTDLAQRGKDRLA